MAAHPSESIKPTLFSQMIHALGKMFLDDQPGTPSQASAQPHATAGRPQPREIRVLRNNSPEPEPILHSIFYFPKTWEDILLAAADLKAGNEVTVNVARLNGPIRDHALCYLRGIVDALEGPSRQTSEDVYEYGVPGVIYTDASGTGRSTREPDYFPGI